MDEEIYYTYGWTDTKDEFSSTNTYELQADSITASGWDISNLCSHVHDTWDSWGKEWVLEEGQWVKVGDEYLHRVKTDNDALDYTDRPYSKFGFYNDSPYVNVYTEISIPSTTALSQTYGSFALEELPENISGEWDYGEGSVLGWSLAASVLGGSGSLLGNKLGLADIIPTQPGEIYQYIESEAVDQLMAHDPNLLQNAAEDLVQEGDADWSFTLFGQVWVMPWSSHAGGFGETAYAYGEAIGMAFCSVIYGAAGGAATGTATGLIVGAIIGGSAGGVGALPGAAAGAVAGLVGGTVWGGLNGLWNAIWKDPDVEDIVVYGESAEEGMVIGVYAGILGPVFNKIAERLAATDLLPAPKTPKPVSAKPSSDASSRTVIGKVKDLKNLESNENSLLNRLPDQGSPKANWSQNSRVLRQEIRLGKPIRDASLNPDGTLKNYPGSFLELERNLLRNQGWTFDPSTGLWNPPK